jgi:hypothetical protein
MGMERVSPWHIVRNGRAVLARNAPQPPKPLSLHWNSAFVPGWLPTKRIVEKVAKCPRRRCRAEPCQRADDKID